MKIYLTGYMGSGKSLIGKELAAEIGYDFIDLDAQIELIEDMGIHKIFEQRGELYFRRLETNILADVIEAPGRFVVSLGGGTPCYGNNFDLIDSQLDSKIVYLKASVDSLTERLFNEKEQRPLISHLESKAQLDEFVRKHLFERSHYYNQADLIVKVDKLSPQEIVEKIKQNL